MYALPLLGIGPVESVSQLVREVGQDLEAYGRKRQKNNGKGVDAIVGGGEENAHHNARERERERPETH